MTRRLFGFEPAPRTCRSRGLVLKCELRTRPRYQPEARALERQKATGKCRMEAV